MASIQSFHWIDGVSTRNVDVMAALIAVVVASVIAGALTTVSGFGGGVLLVLVVTAFAGAKPALAATAISLLVANSHRIWLYRREVRAPVTVPLLLGIVPGAFTGALIAASIPEWSIHVAMLGVVGLGVARAWFGWEWRPGSRTITASGVLVGVLAGAAGGAGFLMGPIVLAAGLSGRRYLATVACGAVAMHVARIAGYGSGGLLTPEVLRLAAVLTPALLLGNLLGDRSRDRIPAVWQRRIEHGAPIVCVALALAGVS
jgi:uncharacterized membrane protein YfcA